MKQKVPSIGKSIRYIIAVMGGLGIVLILVSVNWYRELVFEEQRQSTGAFVRHEVDQTLAQHVSYMADLGMTMQADSEFRAAFADRELQRLKVLLNDQFRQYFVTMGLVDLKKLVLYDTDFNPVVASDVNDLSISAGSACANILERARARSGVARLKSLSDMCRQDGSPMHIVLLPVGGIKLSGYVVVIADMVKLIKPLHETLGMPVRMAAYPEGMEFISIDWPQAADISDVLITDYAVSSADDSGIFTVSVATDVQELNEQLRQVTFGISLIAMILTLAAIAVMMLILRKTISMPLARINMHMRRIRENSAILEEKLEITGCRELVGLSEEFNSMAEQLMNYKKELETQARTDLLTGLPNRSLFYDCIENLVELCNRQERKFALFMIDLNKFKEVNDTLGHHAGDELLRQISARLSNRLRSSDTVARFGGDEFAILLPTIEEKEHAVALARELIDVVSEPYQIEDKRVESGMSVGIAFYPDTAVDIDSLFRCADKSMYYAKKQGLGCFLCEELCRPEEECRLMASDVVAIQEANGA